MSKQLMIKRMGAGWYRTKVNGELFDIEFCSTAEGWGQTGWMFRSVGDPKGTYSDILPSKRDCVWNLQNMADEAAA